MIRKKIVYGKTFKSNPSSFSDPDLFRYIIKRMKPETLTCPYCKQTGCFIRQAAYSRMLIYIEDGIRKEEEIDVPILQCTCKRWHAFFSDVIIPYGSYSARFILHVLDQYLNRTCKVVDLCEKWQISVSTLYDWIHRFTDHFSLWAGVMRAINWVKQEALDEIYSYPDFADEFFNRFLAFSFLQGYKTTVSQPHPASEDSS